MTLLDAYALIAFLVGGPAAAPVRSILREGDAAITTTNLAETLDVCQRLYGLAVDRAMEVIEPLVAGPLATLPLDADVAVASRRGSRASLPPHAQADLARGFVLIASALHGPGARLATADPDVLAVAREEDVATVELPEQG